MMDSQTKLKRVVIKQELVALTGDYFKALILNQFLYWSERTKDYDKFLVEEKERFGPEDQVFNMGLTYGWIYKTATDLNEELMLGVSANTIRRHLSKLVKAGYVDQRNNPNHKWDRTLQYRPNIVAIQTDLEAMGYALDGYPILGHANVNLKVGTDNLTNGTSPNEGAIPEITTEITPENMPLRADDDFSDLLGNDKPQANGSSEPKPKLTEAELAHLQTFGVLPGQEIDQAEYELQQEIIKAGWDIYSDDVRQAIIYFLLAMRENVPKFALPMDDPTRKLWYKEVGGHLKNYSLAQLKDFYRQAIIKMKENDLSCWQPGSLTKWALPEVANAPSLSRNGNGPKLTESERKRYEELLAENG